MKHHFDPVQVVAQGYKKAVSILKLVQHYSAERLENACKMMFEKGQYLRYKHFKTRLQNDQNKIRSVVFEIHKRQKRLL